MDEEGKLLLLIEKPQVFVYEIPERAIRRTGGYLHRAADWNIECPKWHGKLLIYKAGQSSCRLELRESNDSIYGSSVLKEYPGRDFEPVADSSRYFTLNIRNKDGNFQLVGIGFLHRNDSVDLHNVTSRFFSRIPVNKKKKSDEFFEKTERKHIEVVTPPKRIKMEYDADIEGSLTAPGAPLAQYPEPGSEVEDQAELHDNLMTSNIVEMTPPIRIKEERDPEVPHSEIEDQTKMQNNLLTANNEEVAPAIRIKLEYDPDMGTSLTASVEPLPVNSFGNFSETQDDKMIKSKNLDEEDEDASNGTEGHKTIKNEMINDDDEAVKSSVGTIFSGDKLQDELEDGEIEDETEIHDSSLVKTEAQVEPQCPQQQPQEPSKLNKKDMLKIFECTFCNQMLQSREDIIEHFLQTHNSNDYSSTAIIAEAECNATPSEIFSRTNDETYRYISNGLFKCDKCTKAFSSSLEILVHWIAAHKAEQPDCCQCRLPFQFKKERERHVRKFHMIQCHICSKPPFFNRKDVNQHLLSAHLCDPSGRTIHRANDKEFVCLICPGWFNFKSHRWQHIRETHAKWAKSSKLEPGKMEMEDQTKTHGKKPLETDAQEQHGSSQRQTPKENLTNCLIVYSCTFCSKECDSRDNMIKHFRDIHASIENPETQKMDVVADNPNATPGEIFSRTNDPCYRHILNSLFKCGLSTCIETFSSSSKIVQHWITKHGAEPLSIKYCSCGLPFRCNKERNQHMRKCYAIIFCGICDQRFLKQQDVDEHLLLYHLCDPSGKKIHLAEIQKYSLPTYRGWIDFRYPEQEWKRNAIKK